MLTGNEELGLMLSGIWRVERDWGSKPCVAPPKDFRGAGNSISGEEALPSVNLSGEAHLLQ